MSDPALPPVERADPVNRVRRRVTCLLAGFGLLVIAAVLLAAWFGRSSLPVLNRSAFEQAQHTWKLEGPANYDIEVKVTGRQAATYRVEVRGGEVVQATRDDHPLRQLRTLGTWSVPGMFSTIESDLENMEKLASGHLDAHTPQVAVRVRFDPHYGFPRQFHRTELVKRRSNPEVSWIVTQFRKHPPGENSDKQDNVEGGKPDIEVRQAD